MLPLTETLIRSSFINASQKEVKDATLPDTLEIINWEAFDYFGWRDPKFAKRAYAIIPQGDGKPVGIMLQQSYVASGARAMCSWCTDVTIPNDVAFWSVRRVGEAGRRGATVGTLVCHEFECSYNVRNDPPPAYQGFDVAGARAVRIEGLRTKVANFADMLIAGR